MSGELLTDVDYWRRRARRCEELAQLTAQPDRRDTLLSLARAYREQADAAARNPVRGLAA